MLSANEIDRSRVIARGCFLRTWKINPCREVSEEIRCSVTAFNSVILDVVLSGPASVLPIDGRTGELSHHKKQDLMKLSKTAKARQSIGLPVRSCMSVNSTPVACASL
jgi:hypothetical protein